MKKEELDVFSRSRIAVYNAVPFCFAIEISFPMKLIVPIQTNGVLLYFEYEDTKVQVLVDNKNKYIYSMHLYQCMINCLR